MPNDISSILKLEIFSTDIEKIRLNLRFKTTTTSSQSKIKSTKVKVLDIILSVDKREHIVF